MHEDRIFFIRVEVSWLDDPGIELHAFFCGDFKEGFGRNLVVIQPRIQCFVVFQHFHQFAIGLVQTHNRRCRRRMVIVDVVGELRIETNIVGSGSGTEFLFVLTRNGNGIQLPLDRTIFGAHEIQKSFFLIQTQERTHVPVSCGDRTDQFSIHSI